MLHIACIFSSHISSGGGFQQELSTCLILKKVSCIDFHFTFFTYSDENVKILKEHGIESKLLNISKWDNRFFNIIKIKKIAKLLKIKYHKIENIFIKNNIDLLFFLAPDPLIKNIQELNYIVTVWDLCHKDFPEFPEIRKNKNFENREKYYKTVLPKATAIITDSESGRINISQYYHVNKDRIFTLPFLPSESINISDESYMRNYIDIKKKYLIINHYIYYPAQFWSHKNHVYILEGLRILKEKYNIIFDAVFSGNDGGNLKHILSCANDFNISDQIHYIGFADKKEMPYLYKQAIALVMPTYFGPTNIPPLEAFKSGTPVLYPDLPGLKEQVKDAALLMDLNEPESMALQLLKLINSNPDIAVLLEKGKQIVKSVESYDHQGILGDIFRKFSAIRKCWK